MDKQLKCNKPLGKWLNVPHHLIKSHMYTPDGRLYEQEPQGWWIRTPASLDEKKFTKASGELGALPQNSVPVNVTYCGTRIHITKVPTHIKQRTKKRHLTLQEAYASEDENIRSIMGTIRFPQDNGREIMEKINNGDLLCASDGSVKNGEGAYAYCLLDPSSKTALIGGNRCIGPKEDMSSHRTEAYGALGITYALKLIENTYNETNYGENATASCYIDNAEVIRTINECKNGQDIKPNGPEYNVFQEIKINELAIKCKMKWIWIRGHQSEETLVGRANNSMEKEANRIRNETNEIPKYNMLPNYTSEFIKEGKSITSNLFYHIVYQKTMINA